MINIGIIGAGTRGLEFAEYTKQNKNTNLIAICDIDFERTKIFESISDNENLEKYISYKGILNNSDINAFIISSTDYSHSQILQDCIKMKKNVLCDKPIAINLKGLNATKNIFQKHQESVCEIDFVLRYHPFYITLKEMLQKIGSIKNVHINDNVQGGFYFRRWQRLREKSGGLVLHEGIHSIDIALSVISSKVKQVYAIGNNHIYIYRPGAGLYCSDCKNSSVCHEYFDLKTDPLYELYQTPSQQEGYSRDICVYNSNKDTPDNVMSIVEFDNGTLLNYNMCLYSPLRTREFRFYGDNGLLIADETKGIIQLHSRYKEIVKREKVEIASGKFGGSDIALFNTFVSNCMSGYFNPEYIHNSIEANMLALAIEESIKNNSITYIRQNNEEEFVFSSEL
jgi:predicted dehydrogenase